MKEPKKFTVPVKVATYTVMVRPSLECALTVWDTLSQTHIKLQRRAAIYINSSYHSRTPGCVTKMVENLNCEPLTARKKCYVPGVTRKEFRKPKFGIWKVSKKHLLNLTKFLLKITKLSFTNAMENIYTIKESLIYSTL